MRRGFAFGIVASVTIGLLSVSLASAGVKSGLQAGDRPAAFNVRDITGPSAGTSLCYRCQYGQSPVVNVFARETNDNLMALIKQIDQQVEKNGELKAFVVLLTDDAEGAEKKLAKLAKKNEIKNVPLTIVEGTGGPPSYKISKDAEVTVMMWVNSEVKVNHAFSAGELTKGAVTKISHDVAKILN